MHTNFFPIKIPFDEFQIDRIKYSQKKMSDLRKRYNKTHSFFRNDDFIYISPMTSIENGLGKTTTLKVSENMDIVSSLIKHIFFRTFRKKFNDILPTSFYPFRFLSRKNEDDMFFDNMPEDLKGILSFKKQIEIQFRKIKIKDNNTFGAVISTRHRWLFNKNCKKLIEEGYNLKGISVLHSEQIPGLEGVLAPIENRLGKVVNIQRDIINVDTDEGIKEYPANELFLHKSKNNIKQYLVSKIGEAKTDYIFREVRSQDINRLEGKSVYTEIMKIGKQIADLEYLNKDSFNFSISKSSELPNNAFSISEPSFIFDYTPGKTHKIADFGLNDYGPYDSSTFEVKNPKILVVCHKSNRGGFSTFLGKLKNGIPSKKFFQSGMKKKYELHDVDFVLDEIGNYSCEEYEQIIKKQIRMNSFPPFDLAIIETCEHFRKFAIEDNPYFRIKSYLMGLGIPVQFVTNFKIRKSDYELQYICNSIALQIYAKLGGTPWVLPANSNIDREIIIGVGSSFVKNNNKSGKFQERIVGITTFFSGDGKYLLSSKSRDVSYEDYFEELLNNLRSSINELSKEYGWQHGENVRIVFHIFKPIKNIEAEVVDKLISEFDNYNIKFAFVTISEKHPFYLFNPKQQGLKIGEEIKGVYVPNRGSNFVLDECSCLLQIKGPKEIKSAKHKFSNSMLIRIHDKSTFRDLNYITQQIFNFTTLSWRGFLPIKQPTTIYYSNLIVRLLSKLRKISGWNPEIVNGSLKFKKWFL
ncbi:MAG: Piwi domain protein [Spirochaetes bacterium]|nr:Piwi domain protein [Spirochaetota bacterium]